MGKDRDDAAAEIDEIAALLLDPQLREFLEHYLSISEPEGRAHVRQVAASLSLASRPRDWVRRKKLGLSPRGARKTSA